MVQRIISPEVMKLQVKGVRKIRIGVVISTETKTDIKQPKQTVQIIKTGLKVDEPHKRNPRIILIGVPATMAENEVYTYFYK